MSISTYGVYRSDHADFRQRSRGVTDVYAPGVESVHQSVWRPRDFLIALAGGLLGAVIVGLPVLVTGGETENLIVLGSIGQFAGQLAVISWLARTRGGAGSLGFQVEPWDVLYLFVGVGLQFLLPLLMAPLTALWGDTQTGQEVVDQIRDLGGTVARVVMAGVVTVLGPIAEELMFRGVLLKSLSAGGIRRASLISAACFSGYHLFGLTGDLLTGVILLFPIFLLVGLVLARVTVRRGRLGPAIFIHSGFNLLAVVVLLIPPELLEQVPG
jgi:membrane protease YdiL (CAAX protease family)